MPIRGPQAHPVSIEFIAQADDGATTLVVRGALDAVTAPAFTHHVRQAVADLDAGQLLIIDLRELDLLAVAGTRALVDAARLCAVRELACHLVARPDHDARTVLDRLDVPPALRIVEDAAHVTRHRS